jgi:hypothetical protein
MQYKDIHNIYPGSTKYRTPSPGSDKPDPNTPIWAYNFKWDYKIPYRGSVHWVRRFHPEFHDPTNRTYTGFKFTQKDIEEHSKKQIGFKGMFIYNITKIILFYRKL